MRRIAFKTIIKNPPMVKLKSSYDSSGGKCKSYTCSLNSNLSSRFFLITRGKLTFHFNDKNGVKKKIIAQENDIVYIPYNAEYYSVWNNIDIAKYNSIEFYLYDENSNLLCLYNNIKIILNDSNIIYKTLFDEITHFYMDVESGNLLKCISIFYDLLRQISIFKLENEYAKQYNSIYNAIMYIENNYIEDFPVSFLAKMCNMCETTLRKSFKEKIGMSPVEYRNYLRLKKASKLLQNDMLSITYISESVGINDIHYFCRKFKKQYGVSPLQYKKNLIQDQNI